MSRSPNGKGHFWAINPINYDDFSRGEYKKKELQEEIESVLKQKDVQREKLRQNGIEWWRRTKMLLTLQYVECVVTPCTAVHAQMIQM